MSVPREFYMTADGSLGMKPVGELELLRTHGPEAVRTSADGAVVARYGDGVGALDVELAWPDGGQGEVSLLDGDGTVVISAVVGQEGISISGPTDKPAKTEFSSAGSRPVVRFAPVRMLYAGGVCEVFSPTGEARAEVLYSCPPVFSVLCGRRDHNGRTIASSPADVRAWELAGP
jgi:hypothetical protein